MTTSITTNAPLNNGRMPRGPIAGYLVGIGLLYTYLLAGPAARVLIGSRLPAGFASLTSVFGSDGVRAVLFTLSYGLWIAVFVWCLRRLTFQQISRKSVFAWAIVFAVLLLAFPPHFSDDIIGYAQYGRIMAHYGANPYIHTLSEFNDAWAQHRRYWAALPSPYGPVMNLVFAAAAWIGGESLVATVVVLKIVMTGCYLFSGWCIANIIRQLQPQAEVRSAFFFLWNPLVLLEVLAQGHNDAVMIAVTLAGLLLIVRNRFTHGYIALVVGALTKVATIVILPLYIGFLIVRREYKSLLIGSLASALLLFLAWWSWYREPGAFSGILTVSRLSWRSPVWLAQRAGAQLGLNSARVGVYLQVLVVLFIAIFFAVRAKRIRSHKSFLGESALATAMFLLVISTQINTWYLALLVALAATSLDSLTETIAVAVTTWPIVLYFRFWLYSTELWVPAVQTVILYTVLAAFLIAYARRTIKSRQLSLTALSV